MIIKGISNIHSNNTLRYDNLDEFFNFLLSLDKKDYIFCVSLKDEKLKEIAKLLQQDKVAAYEELNIKELKEMVEKWR